jgi:Protein of unknown function (DUF3102)
MSNIAPVARTQATRSNSATALSDLAEVIRTEHTAIVAAFSRALQHALTAGRALIEAKDLVGHGHWRDFLKDCDLGERQAERYAQLVRLYDANPSSGTDLAGLSVQAAIKRLSPKQSNAGSAQHAPSQPPAAEKLNSLAWANASPNERARFICRIGCRSLAAAVPADWLPIIQDWLQAQPPKETTIAIDEDGNISDDLSIPSFLRRDLHAEGAAQ